MAWKTCEHDRRTVGRDGLLLRWTPSSPNGMIQIGQSETARWTAYSKKKKEKRRHISIVIHKISRFVAVTSLVADLTTSLQVFFFKVDNLAALASIQAAISSPEFGLFRGGWKVLGKEGGYVASPPNFPLRFVTLAYKTSSRVGSLWPVLGHQTRLTRCSRGLWGRRKKSCRGTSNTHLVTGDYTVWTVSREGPRIKPDKDWGLTWSCTWSQWASAIVPSMLPSICLCESKTHKCENRTGDRNSI